MTESRRTRSPAHQVRPRDPALDLTPFDVIFTGYKRVGSRFQMSWVESWPDAATGLLVAKPGGRTSTGDVGGGDDDFADGAWNMNENGDDGAGIEAGGVNVDGTAYPVGFFKQPIRGDDGFNSPDPGTEGSWDVSRGPAGILWPRIASDGATIIYQFERMNQHDGGCDEALGSLNQQTANYLLQLAGREPALRALVNRIYK